MFGQSVSVDTGAVEDTGSRVRAGAGEIRMQLDRLLANVAGLTDSQWRGVASTAFADQYRQLNDGWRQVETALESIAGQLRTTATAYVDNDESLRRMFSQR